MATIIQSLNSDPVDVVSSQSLVIGTNYSCQYIGPNNVLMRFLESVDIPEIRDESNLLEPLRSIRVVPKSGEGVYVWLTPSNDGYLSINEVA